MAIRSSRDQAVGEIGYQRQCHREIRSRFVQPQTAHHIDIGIQRTEEVSAPFLQYCQEQSHPVEIKAGCCAPGISKGGFGHQGLNLRQNRRLPSIRQVTQVPDTFTGRPESIIMEGFATSVRPRSVISKTPISLVEP